MVGEVALQAGVGLDPGLWHDPLMAAALVERVLARSWHCVGDLRDLTVPGSWSPRTLLPGSLDEPVLLVRGPEGLRAFSNVCTHRLALLADAPGRGRAIVCPYHGRSFDLAGRCRGQRGFSGVVDDFPGDPDHLAPLAVATFGGLAFVAIDPVVTFESLITPIAALLPALDLGAAAVSDGPVYEVDAPFVAWCENYLEGLHVPFVHPGLSAVLDPEAYEVRPLPRGCSVQAGVVAAGQPALSPHPAWPGRRLGGLYATLFPTTMINIYPWGVSLNLVEPLGARRSRIVYRAFVHHPELRDRGAGAGLDTVEAEDQAVVRRVGRGLRSRLARPPRFAPGHESAVEGFHQELKRLLDVT